MMYLMVDIDIFDKDDIAGSKENYSMHTAYLKSLIEWWDNGHY